MRDLRTRLILGSVFLAVGIVAVGGGRPLRLLDFKERQCRSASAAVGSACPAGCVARPVASAEDRARPTECHSRLWRATCGSSCGPSPELVRLPDGRLADGRRLLVTFSDVPDAELQGKLDRFGVKLEPRFDAMFRYEAVLPEAGDAAELEKTKKRLAALPLAVSVDYLLR